MEESRVIIELVATIILYKFKQLSPMEIQTMLDIPIRESRLYTEGQASILIRLLNKKVGELPDEVMENIGQLSASRSEALAEAVLDFTGLADLQTWLQAHQS